MVWNLAISKGHVLKDSPQQMTLLGGGKTLGHGCTDRQGGHWVQAPVGILRHHRSFLSASWLL
jgi:hypothetical protein